MAALIDEIVDEMEKSLQGAGIPGFIDMEHNDFLKQAEPILQTLIQLGRLRPAGDEAPHELLVAARNIIWAQRCGFQPQRTEEVAEAFLRLAGREDMLEMPDSQPKDYPVAPHDAYEWLKRQAANGSDEAYVMAAELQRLMATQQKPQISDPSSGTIA